VDCPVILRKNGSLPQSFEFATTGMNFVVRRLTTSGSLYPASRASVPFPQQTPSGLPSCIHMKTGFPALAASARASWREVLQGMA